MLWNLRASALEMFCVNFITYTFQSVPFDLLRCLSPANQQHILHRHGQDAVLGDIEEQRRLLPAQIGKANPVLHRKKALRPGKAIYVQALPRDSTHTRRHLVGFLAVLHGRKLRNDKGIGIIVKNPLSSRSIRISGRSAKPTAPYSIEQMQHIVSNLSAVKRPDDRAFIALMSLHPLRLEECLGLKYADIDRSEHMIHIVRSATHPTRNQPHIKQTKTELSRRDIELTAGILNHLPEGRDNDFLLGGDAPLSYTQLRRMLNRIRKDIGFEETIVPQRFRTTVLTDIYDTTKDIKKTQAAAGHTTAAMTLKHYVKGRNPNLNTAEPVPARYGLSNA